jgi:hypothetical protein
VEHKDTRGDRDADDQCHGTGQGEQPQLSTGHSIQPGTAVPPTVLVANMGTGSLFLQGWQGGPSAYLTSSNAIPLPRELAAAFGSTKLAFRGDQGEAL